MPDISLPADNRLYMSVYNKMKPVTSEQTPKCDVEVAENVRRSVGVLF